MTQHKREPKRKQPVVSRQEDDEDNFLYTMNEEDDTLFIRGSEAFDAYKEYCRNDRENW